MVNLFRLLENRKKAFFMSNNLNVDDIFPVEKIVNWTNLSNFSTLKNCYPVSKRKISCIVRLVG